MKHWLRMLAAGAVLAGALAVSAAAADYTACADHLHTLGLFQGTEQGYELDRAPTRGEAAVMLVRLLGKEESALALDYTAPFTDLAGWEQPYVQYLYQNGLTTGVSQTAYAPQEPCTAQMYAAFLLRALGYTESAGDFSYAQAITAAQEHGVYDPAVIDTEEFLRDDVVAASYTALSVTEKNGGGTLLDRLVQDGTVQAEVAEPYQALFNTYAAYRADTAGMQELQRFSVQSSYLTPVTFRRGDAQGDEMFSLQIHDTTTVDRSANTLLTDSQRTLSAGGVANKTAKTQIRVADGVFSQGQYQSNLSAVQQAQWLAGYAPVPIAWIQTAAQESNGKWVFSFAQLPSMYLSWMQPVADTVGSLTDADWQNVSVTQSTKGGLITAQQLTAAVETDGVYGQMTLVSTLDQEL